MVVCTYDFWVNPNPWFWANCEISTKIGHTNNSLFIFIPLKVKEGRGDFKGGWTPCIWLLWFTLELFDERNSVASFILSILVLNQIATKWLWTYFNLLMLRKYSKLLHENAILPTISKWMLSSFTIMFNLHCQLSYPSSKN